MKTFFNILQPIINKTEKIYPDENTMFSFQLRNNNSNDFIYIYSLIQSIHENKNVNHESCNETNGSSDIGIAIAFASI